MRTLLYAILVIWHLVPLIGQSGPGGVGNPSSNGLWLRADALSANPNDPVVLWPDQSGNANHARQTVAGRIPVYTRSSDLNGMPAVRLDGIDDQMIVTDNDILDGSTGITYFAVIRPRNLDSQPRGILGKRITYTQEIEYAYTWFFWSSNRMHLDVHTNNDRFNFSSVTFQNDQDYLLSWDFDGSRSAASRSVMYLDDRQQEPSSEQSTQLPNSNRDLVLGALNVDYGSYLGADYAEVIHYNYALNEVERLLVNNYLAGKYGLALTGSDVYRQDDSANGDYDFDIAGIGRNSAGVAVTEARGSGVVTVSNPRDLDDDEYMLWGHDGGDLTLSAPTTALPLFDALAGRTWRISETSAAGVPVFIGGVDLTFSLPDYDPADAEKLALLIDSNDDGSFTDETPVAGATYLGDGTYAFVNVSEHRDGSRIRIGRLTEAAVATLPTELFAFTVEVVGNNTVVAGWKASEQSVAAYTLERSTDGVQWQAITRTAAVSTSSGIHTYRSIDRRAPVRRVYYRLRITGADGQHTFSAVQIAELPGTHDLRLYPNPSHGILTLEGPKISPDQLRWYNGRGQEVTHHVQLVGCEEGRIRASVAGLPPGLYRVIAGSDAYTVLVQR